MTVFAVSSLSLKILLALQGMFWCPFQHCWRHPCHRQVLQKKNPCSLGCVPCKCPSAGCVVWQWSSFVQQGQLWKVMIFQCFQYCNRKLVCFFFFSHHGFKLWVHILWFDTLAVPWCFFYVIDWNLLLMKSLWAVPLVSLKWTLQSRPLTAAGSTRRLLQEKAACTTCTLQLAQSEQGRKQLTDHLCFLY